MTGRRRERARWMIVVTFAAGMAWVEAACVYYLRVVVDRVEPYQPDPLPIRRNLGELELVREGATLLIVAMTGMLARRTWPERQGYRPVRVRPWARGVFMGDSIGALPGGLDTVRRVLPTAFNWPVFGAALLLMATPLAPPGWRSLSGRREVRTREPRTP